MSHIEPTDSAFIIVGPQHLLPKQGIALFTDLQDIKSQLLGEFFLNAFGKVCFEDLLSHRVNQVLTLYQKSVMLLVKTTCNMMFN
ncbi:hypothetical protein GCM10023078_35380 [Gibbsiella greigii]